MQKPNDNKMEERMAKLLRPWLEKRNYSPDVFWKLDDYFKKQLYRAVCHRDHLTDTGYTNLYNALRRAEAADARAGKYADPVGHWTPQQFKEFFSSDASDDETHANLSKY